MFNMKRVLGIDYGDVRVGLAISDPLGITAQGLDTLVINGDDKLFISGVLNLIKEYDVSDVVIGYPKNMDGTISKKAMEIDKLIEKIQKLNVPVEKWDERLTTVIAYGTMRQLGIKQKQKNKFADKLAATTILQDYLKYING